MTISTTSTLRQHHQHCDELFSLMEKDVSDHNWVVGLKSLESFLQEMEDHFHCEEETLFPAFEAATGMTQGPTQVMRVEHAQMRNLMQQLREASTVQDEDAFIGAAETLLILMQQHNMKEENILYPMCDQHVDSDIGQKIRSAIPGKA